MLITQNIKITVKSSLNGLVNMILTSSVIYWIKSAIWHQHSTKRCVKERRKLSYRVSEKSFLLSKLFFFKKKKAEKAHISNISIFPYWSKMLSLNLFRENVFLATLYYSKTNNRCPMFTSLRNTCRRRCVLIDLTGNFLLWGKENYPIRFFSTS